MPKFMKQVRNFLNNSPFKMYGTKPTPAKFNASLKKASASGKLNGSPKFKAAVDASSAMKMYNKPAPLKATVGGRTTKPETKKPETKIKADPYAEAAKKDSKLGKYVSKRKTLKKGSAEWNANQNKINKAYGVKKRYNEAPATAPATAPASQTTTSTETRNANSIGGSTGRDNSADAITRRAQASQNKKDLAPTGKRAATKPPKKIASAEATRAIEASRKKLQDAKGQEKNMQDKNKLKAEIKTLRKSDKKKDRKKTYNTAASKEAGKKISNQELLKEKRQAKRKKGKAIRKYKRDPNALKVDKVKKASAAKMYKKKK